LAFDDKEFFNKVASDWDHRANRDPEKVRHILSFVGITPGSAVLDVGCGTGGIEPYLLEQVGSTGHITGLDYSEKMLEKAREKFPKELYPNIDFVFSDILQFQTNEKFDFVICFTSFPHFPDKKDSIEKMASLLKSGGKLAICEVQSREKVNTMHRQMGEDMEKVELPPPEVILSYMAQAGLEAETVVDNEEEFVIVGKKTIE
jgi:demethylmenaquinone methyltransferase/2-methoxy-6-polyprenyl-1,4-benzoquinol methylase